MRILVYSLISIVLGSASGERDVLVVYSRWLVSGRATHGRLLWQRRQWQSEHWSN